MIDDEDTIKTVPQFLQNVYDLEKKSGVRCFRGEANCSWKLKPSVMRDLKPNAERHIISELMLDAPDEFQSDDSMFRKLVRAQHYGLPTRLLDVTLNPLVALFFACADETELEADGHVLVLDFLNARIKFADSDTVTVLSNLAKLNDEEKSIIEDCINDCKKRRLTGEKIREEVNNLDEIDRLVHFARMEKPYFRKQVDPTDFKKYYFVHPPKSNRRISAQSGAFVVAGLLEYKSIHKANSFATQKALIKAEHKGEILKQLDDININHRAMYPEIEFASRYIKRKWTRKKQEEHHSVDPDLLI